MNNHQLDPLRPRARCLTPVVWSAALHGATLLGLLVRNEAAVPPPVSRSVTLIAPLPAAKVEPKAVSARPAPKHLVIAQQPPPAAQPNIQVPPPSIDIAAPVALAKLELPHLEPPPSVAARVNKLQTGSFGTEVFVAAKRTGMPQSAGGFSESTVAGSAKPTRRISNGTFGDAVLSKPFSMAGRGSGREAPAVEILFKPRPVYSDEARRERIEGEVVLEMEFRASGEARVLRVVEGLGHGLDEAAISAAQEIRFRATGDAIALVHIEFRLAY